MANFNLVVDTSNFKPYDISPALQILHDYRDAYYKLDEQLNKIAEEKGQYIPPEGSTYRTTMDKYNQDFSSVVDDFSRGMNMRNAAAVRNLRNRYLEEITPINRAAEAYNKYQDKLTALGPDAIIGNSRTFDDFYGGKNPAIEYRSAKEIQRTAAGVMQGLDNALMKAPEQAGDIAKQYFILRQQGLNGQEALTSIIQHNPMNQQTAGDVSQLAKALDDVYNTFSKDSFSDDAKSKIWENTMLGAIQGIQAPKYSMQHNQGYLNPAQQYNLEQSRREDKFKYTYDENGQITGFNSNYLSGAYSGRGGRGATGLTERVPNGGTFHATEMNMKEDNVVSSSEVERSTVPAHIASQYPEDTKFLKCKDKSGKDIGYIAIKYTDRKVVGQQGGTNVSVQQDSEATMDESDLED